MIVGILRNSAANIKVIERVVQLLSIPLVLLSKAEIMELKAVSMTNTISSGQTVRENASSDV